MDWSRFLAAFLSIIGLTISPWVQAQIATTPSKSAATNGSAKAVVVAEGLDHPWAMAFLPGEPAGRMLVTERAGKMRVISADGKVGAPLTGVPAVHGVVDCVRVSVK